VASMLPCGVHGASPTCLQDVTVFTVCHNSLNSAFWNLKLMIMCGVSFVQVKCCKYWPDVKSTSAFGPYEVRCVSEQLDHTYITRYFTLRNIKVCSQPAHFIFILN